MIARCGQLVISLVILMSPAGCGHPPVELSEPDLSKADPLVAESIRLSAQHVRDSGGQPAAWAEYGRVCWSNAFVEEAMDAFNNALVRDPDNARFLYARGLIAREAFDLQSALQDLLRARELEPDEIFLHWRAAWIAMELGELNQAMTVLKSAQAIDANDRNTIRVGARLKLEQGEAEEGLAILQPLLVNGNTDRDVLWLQARLLRAAGLGDEAAALAVTTGQQTPRYTDPWAAWAKGRRTGVAAEMDRALKLAGEKRHTEAMGILVKLKGMDVEERHLDLLSARLNIAKGQSTLAVVALTQLVEREPDWAPPHHELGMLMVRPQQGRGRPPKSDIQRAIELLSRASELEPDSHLARASLVHVLVLDEQWDEAAEHAALCVQAAPLNRFYRTRLAGAQVAGGNASAGLETLDAAAELFGGEETAPAVTVRLRAHIANQDLIGAALLLEELKRRFPKYPAIPRLESMIQKASP